MGLQAPSPASVDNAARALIEAAEALRATREQADRTVPALEARWATNRAALHATRAASARDARGQLR